MSQAQLNRLLVDKEKLVRELERTKTIIKVSEACEALIASVKGTPDPFSPDWRGANPWLQTPNPKCPCA
eukprot:m51a1_g12370 hypothetical protein (69) ;mRNA; f:602960-603294